MSWMKKRSQTTTPSPSNIGQQAGSVPMFNPNQTYQWQPNDHYLQQPKQNYWDEQQGYTNQPNLNPNNENPEQFQQYFNQNAQQNQNYGNHSYNHQYFHQNNQPVTHQNNQPVSHENNQPVTHQKSDPLDNWGWGDEDNSNLQTVQQTQQHETANIPRNFSKDESWDWSIDDSGLQVDETINTTVKPDTSHPLQETNEAPMNDRNQYLETGQLSDLNQMNEVMDESTNLRLNLEEDLPPPPGLRRMVLGQIEQNESVENVENFYDEPPPPGLSRMVLGQNEIVTNQTNSNVTDNNEMDRYDINDPPEGLRRMVPGESSSPENLPTFNTDNSNLEYQQQIPQLRSATIGADPSQASSLPITSQSHSSNRSETIGAADSDQINVKANNPSPINGKKLKDKKLDSQRRDFIDDEINSITSNVRSLTVGENKTDENDLKLESRRKANRKDSSESEEEIRDKYSNDRRYKSSQKEMEYSQEHSRGEGRRHEKRSNKSRYVQESVDYLSDDERNKSNTDKEYEKRYNSLRRDKERDRRRGSPREYEKDSRRKRNDYYHRYDDSFDNEDRSRPSSRSDSLHDSVYKNDRRYVKESKERRRDRPRDKHRRPREPYGYVQDYGGYGAYNSYQYHQYPYQYNPSLQYYENLRRTDPQAYAKLYYSNYYGQNPAVHPPVYGNDDRSSVHSGRSSTKDSFPKTKDQVDSIKTGRVTPAKFTTAHTNISINSGRLIKIPPNYPKDGQLALVELIQLNGNYQKDDEFKELANYPGPLIKDQTHKKTVIDYCENKIKNVNVCLDIVDPDSYVLLWQLLILLIKQNGKVVGIDIAELLLKNKDENTSIRSSSVLSNTSGNIGDVSFNDSTNQFDETLPYKEEEITNKFIEYLLYGAEQEALEWAMSHNLWGHALFLSTLLGNRTHSKVMERFANGISRNNPLQTLYQLLSGRMPAAVSGVVDERWGDWKPHLAMILSNTSLKPELKSKAITALADSLMTRGSLFAAQFCYLMTDVGFGLYGSENVKIVLLGSNHNKPFSYFATNEAIHMTEIYEYACSLNDPEFVIPELQAYKYLLATRLADRGLLEKSLLYLEKTALYIINNGLNVQSSLVINVYNLADKLKYYDAIDDGFDNSLVDNRLDDSWLMKLRLIKDNIDSGLITQQVDDVSYVNQLAIDQQTSLPQQDIYPQPEQPLFLNDPQIDQQTNQYVPVLPTENYQQDYSMYQEQQQQPQQQFWSNPQPQEWETGNQSNMDQIISNQQNYEGLEKSQNEDEEQQRPQISIPNQTKGKSIFDDEPLPNEKMQKPMKNEVTEQQQQQQKENSTGWLGGIFGFSKKSKQAHLPDDKNPSIVYDKQKKCWLDSQNANNSTSNEIRPPPKLRDMKPIGEISSLPPNVGPTLMSSMPPHLNTIPTNNMQMPEPSQIPLIDANTQQQTNMFKLQKSRNLKKSYVDVFNPGGANVTSSNSNRPVFPTSNPAVTTPINFLIPQPVNDPNYMMQPGTQIMQNQRQDSSQIHQ